jgi:hypothetical protein
MGLKEFKEDLGWVMRNCLQSHMLVVERLQNVIEKRLRTDGREVVRYVNSANDRFYHI